MEIEYNATSLIGKVQKFCGGGHSMLYYRELYIKIGKVLVFDDRIENC